MCYNRTVNNQLHERYLRIVYKNKKPSFKEPPGIDKSVPIHIKNLQTLETEMFHVYRNISSPIVWELFPLRTSDYNLRQFSQLSFTNARSVFCGTENT